MTNNVQQGLQYTLLCYISVMLLLVSVMVVVAFWLCLVHLVELGSLAAVSNLGSSDLSSNSVVVGRY